MLLSWRSQSCTTCASMGGRVAAIPSCASIAVEQRLGLTDRSQVGLLWSLAWTDHTEDHPFADCLLVWLPSSLCPALWGSPMDLMSLTSWVEADVWTEGGGAPKFSCTLSKCSGRTRPGPWGSCAVSSFLFLGQVKGCFLWSRRDTQPYQNH